MKPSQQQSAPGGEWLDRMYNNRLLVAGYEAHLRRWTDESVHARATLPCELDLRYGDGLNETLDIFPAAQPGAPVLVFIHGGYWRALDKRDFSFVASAFATQGVCVVVPNYALCPAVTVPHIGLQMARAVAWTWRHIGRHGGDASRITVAGHSAGGHLAAMVLGCQWPRLESGLPPGLVRGALGISGLYDLEPLSHTPFLQPDLRLTPDQVRQASPATWPAPPQGRFYAVAGGDESAEFIRQNELIRKAWGPARVPVCETLPGRNHFSVVEALVEPGHRLHALARELVSA